MLTLIDGNSLFFRAYYGVRANLSRSDGTPTGAVYGFLNMLLPVLAAAKKTDVFICAFDASRKTFRNDIYPEYKANRTDTPPDLITQLHITIDLLNSIGLPVLQVKGIEADDVIATLATQNCQLHDKTRIITSDKDMMQLVSDCVYIYDGMKNMEIYAPGVFDKFGVRPDQVIDVQSLMGDSSDNVPGVRGVGPKKAAELIVRFETLENLYENLDKIENERTKNLLIEYKEMAFLSKKLVTLKTDAMLPTIPMTPFEFKTTDALQFVEKELESNSIAIKIQKLFGNKSDEQNEKSKTIKTKQQYKTIFTATELDEFLSCVKDVLAFDTETTGLNQMTAKIVGVSLATSDDMGIYIPIRHIQKSNDLFGGDQVVPNQLSIKIVRKKLWPLLTNNKIKKVGHNLKYDFHILENEGWNTSEINNIDDTMLMSYILYGSLHGHGLDELAKLYLDHENIHFNSLFENKKNSDKHFEELDIDVAAPYAAEDANICFALHKIFIAALSKQETLKKLYETYDLPLLWILLSVERNGVLVDKNKLNGLSKTFHKQLKTLESEIWKLTGHEFNIGSPKQLAGVLFDEMGLPANKKKSTDANSLNDLIDENPVISKILEWRSISKLAGTYADALPRQIGTDGRIHTNYLQTSTNTGRLSSRDPNLQNIPIKSELGEEIRKCFIAPPGKVLIAADYSQIQLRLLADFADVKSFKETFLTGTDIHERTARQVFGIEKNIPVPRDLRRAAKTINFSIIYGISSFGLANQLDVSRTEAQSLINSYMSGLPEIKKYIEKTKQFATENAYVYTPWGRRIELPGIKISRMRAYALRAAINAPIQGFEADIMRAAMINTYNNITKNNDKIKIIMQVHDEIVFECDADIAQSFAEKIKAEMESVVQLSIPLLAEYNIDDSWGK